MRQGILELVKSAVFDTLFVPENLHNGKGLMFTIPYGQYAGRSIKDYQHTSMQCAAMLPAPQKFLVQKIRLGFYGYHGFIPTSHRIWQGTFVLEASGLKIAAGTLLDYASEGCWEEAQRLNQFVDGNSKKGGEPLPQDDATLALFQRVIEGRRDPSIVTLLEQQQCFDLTVNIYEPGNAPVIFVASMEGILARAVV
jgi:hypothetical protein